MKFAKLSVIASAILLCPVAAAAQQSGWETRVSVYGWASALETSANTPNGTVTGELSISDVLSDLKTAFMGAFEARNDRWSIVGDLVFANIGIDSAVPPNGAGFTGATLNPKLTVGSAYGMYQVAGGPNSRFDVGLGLRGIAQDVDTKLDPGDVRFNSSDTWVDTVVAVRYQADFNDKWYGTAFADAGAGSGGDTNSWQVLGTVGYRLNDTWSVVGGYRYMSIENSSIGDGLNIDLSGPLLGVAARF